MCLQSVILQAGRDQVPSYQWNRQNFDEYKEILRKIDELDKKLGQPECHDPEKEAWMKDMEERLSRLESDSGSQA